MAHNLITTRFVQSAEKLWKFTPVHSFSLSLSLLLSFCWQWLMMRLLKSENALCACLKTLAKPHKIETVCAMRMGYLCIRMKEYLYGILFVSCSRYNGHSYAFTYLHQYHNERYIPNDTVRMREWHALLSLWKHKIFVLCHCLNIYSLRAQLKMSMAWNCVHSSCECRKTTFVCHALQPTQKIKKNPN